ncbi:MAG: LuxR family transcriptional regulator, maltose regulon positive regulatory protein [Clostridiales bacterium]|nr:LuxR family transcriptional regulator, maltose regulon positive regulatory protein [Clostridiales bacterium]
MQEYKNGTEHITYFSENLSQRMKLLNAYPATLVVAPMGYGKTTWVTEAVSRMDANIVWQKIYDKTSSDFWAGFYHAVKELDRECADKLAQIGILEGRFVKRELMLVLESLHVVRDTFFVIDDYHYIKSSEADEFLFLFIKHMPENLHLILITRNSFKGAGELELKGYLYKIGTNDLSFSKADIELYFSMQGILLSEQQLKELCQYSEGWISALYLFTLDYRMHGDFVFTSSVQELIYQTIYDPLDPDKKDFLLSICQFDVFNLKQAKEVWEQENAEQLLEELLYSNAFMKKDSVTFQYSLHNIFRLCLKEQFEKLTMEKQRTLWKKTGEAMRNNGQLISAMECFYHAGQFDDVLLILGTKNPRNLHRKHKDLLLCCYRDCSEEVKNRHPFSILSFCMDMTTLFRELEWFYRGCRDFERSMQKNQEFTIEERTQLTGEYELLLAYHAFNDIDKMREHHQKAYKLLHFAPRFIDLKDIFTFGAPSILYLYYREAGKLKDLVQYVNRVPSCYMKFTNGHGEGYASVFQAEWMYFCGDYSEAEIAAREGISLAHAKGQADIELCGLFVLARVFLCRGEASLLTEQIGQIEALARHETVKYQTHWLLYAMDLVRGYLFEALDQTDEVAEWIWEHEYGKHLIFNSISFADIVYGKALLQKKEYVKLLGMTESFCQQAAIFPNLLVQVYTYIYETAAHESLFRSESANEALGRAMDIAMPDGLILPFVENTREIEPVLSRLLGKPKYMDFIGKIKRAYVPYRKSVEMIKSAYFRKEAPSLTPRERQIGLLAVDGRNNREIAEILYISPNTVKAEMKSLFAKLGINSRVLLTKEMLIEK